MRNGWLDRFNAPGARWLIDLTAMLLAIGLGGLAAWRAFPFWDDAALWLSEVEGGAVAITRWQPDRPLLGAITAALAARGLLWIVGGVVYAVTWILTGVITLAMWRRFFPEWASYGVVASLLAVSPVLLETQTIVVNNMHIEAILPYASQWLVWQRVGRAGFLLTVLAGACVFGVSLLSEYATLATMVAAGAFYGLSGLEGRDSDARRRDRWLLVAMIACGLVGYLVYHTLGNADARPEIRPERQLVSLGWRHLVEVLVRLPFSLWTGLLGELLKDMGEANLSRATVWGIPCGLTLATLVAFRTMGRPSTPGAIQNQLAPSHGRRALVLFVPLVIGLSAVLVMSTTIRGNVASRFWQPMIPVVSCLSLFLLLTIVRSKFRATIAILCAFTAGYLEGNAAAYAGTARRHTDALGERLHRELAPSGLTAAMFVNFPTNRAIGDPLPRPYELIAHLTRGWPSGDRERFWAGAYGWQPIHESVPGLGGVCGAVKQISSDTLRGWRRRGLVAKVIWVSFDADGVAHVEPIPPSIRISM